jgi:hypothetical protein
MKATVYAFGLVDCRTLPSLYSVRVHNHTPWVSRCVDVVDGVDGVEVDGT